jgi:hypothetical protein
MKLLHLSSRKNRDDIMSHGLIPNKVKNVAHLETFRHDGLVGDRVLYTWSPDSGLGTDKYAKDMIYCKQFIHPRNDMHTKLVDRLRRGWNAGHISDWYDNEFTAQLDMSILGGEIFGGDCVYDLYEIDINEGSEFGRFIHIQDREKCSTTSQLDEEYAHSDKEIFLFDHVIIPSRIRLAHTVNSQVFNNKIHTTWKRP